MDSRQPPAAAGRISLRLVWSAVIAAAIGACAIAEARAALPERSERIVSYTIEATLDPAAHTVKGRENVTWRNTTHESVGDLQIHLYLNAFKNEKTTFMKESNGSHRGYRIKPGEWGWVDVTSLRLASGADLLSGASFIRPDDGNPDDETVLSVPLPSPIPPGGDVSFLAEFTSRLPRVFARTGYKGSFYLVGQWFPKLGVYEEAGFRGREKSGWNCHQFHSMSEFYADFGSFDVTITVPAPFVVGATGSQAGPPRLDADGTATYRFTQEDVHDFAWTADPRYVKVVRTFSYAAERDPDEERRMARVLGLDASTIPPAGAADLSGVPEPLRLSDVEVTLLVHPEHAAQIDRHFEAVFAGLRYFGVWYGRYPYRTLTVVDPAYGARGAGGMEYPTFITAGSSYFAPRRRESPEGVTVHEFGHQFWYGLVANNEFEEAWLDEGFNTYSTGKVLERAFGPNEDAIEVEGIPFVRFPLMTIPIDPSPSGRARPERDPLQRFLYLRFLGASNDSLLNLFRDLPFLTFPGDVPVHEPWARRNRYLFAGPKSDEMVRPAWEYADDGSYRINAYDKPALTLTTLEALVGADTVARAMRVYHERFRFRHPSTDDFVATVSEVAGRDMRAFFDQTARGSDELDYEVTGADAVRSAPGAGLYGPPASRRTVSPEQARAASKTGEEAPREWEVRVRREGEVVLPVKVEVTLEGGATETHEWDGRSRWLRIRGSTKARLASARVLPAAGGGGSLDGYALDVDWSNDARSAVSDPWPALKWWTRLVAWAQQVLYFYSGIA